VAGRPGRAARPWRGAALPGQGGFTHGTVGLTTFALVLIAATQATRH
jgi:hypothetical protein